MVESNSCNPFIVLELCLMMYHNYIFLTRFIMKSLMIKDTFHLLGVLITSVFDNADPCW